MATRNEQLDRLAQAIGARHGLSCAFFNANEGPYDQVVGGPEGRFSTHCPDRDLRPTTQRFEAARVEFERARSQVEGGLAGDPRAALTPRPPLTVAPIPPAYPVYPGPVFPSAPVVPAYTPPEMRPVELPRPEPRPWEPVPMARMPASRSAVPSIDRGWTMHEMWIDISDTAWYPGRGPDAIPMSDVLVYGAGSGPGIRIGQETPTPAAKRKHVEILVVLQSGMELSDQATDSEIAGGAAVREKELREKDIETLKVTVGRSTDLIDAFLKAAFSLSGDQTRRIHSVEVFGHGNQAGGIILPKPINIGGTRNAKTGRMEGGEDVPTLGGFKGPTPTAVEIDALAQWLGALRALVEPDGYVMYYICWSGKSKPVPGRDISTLTAAGTGLKTTGFPGVVEFPAEVDEQGKKTGVYHAPRAREKEEPPTTVTGDEAAKVLEDQGVLSSRSRSALEKAIKDQVQQVNQRNPKQPSPPAK